MTKKLILEGLTVAPSVIETIVALAAESLEGVTVPTLPSLRKNAARSIEINTDEDGNLIIGIHVQVAYGAKLHDVGEQIQAAVIDALSGQVGVTPRAVDVYVDSIVFAE